MNADTTDRPNGNSNVTGEIVRALLKVGAYIVSIAVLLFLSSGRLDWAMGWVYVGVTVAFSIVGTLTMSRELILERARIREDTKDWDKVLVNLAGRLGPMAVLLVAGLDVRYSWTTPIPLWLQIVALLVFLLGLGLNLWAILVNKFFSTTVRIQKERGHTIVTSGPYQFVRHPGYVGGILFNLAMSLMLGSLWALIPAGFTTCTLVVRTALEDRTLHRELDGYQEYAARVRYRLLPGVW